MKKFKVLVLLLLLVISNQLNAKDEIKYIDLTILGAVIAPNKIDRTTWDATSSFKVDSATTGLLIDTIGMSTTGIPVSKVLNTIGNNAAKGSAAPDVIGYVELEGTSLKKISNIAWTKVALATKANKTKNSYTPMFNAGYRNWPLFKENRFRITLKDADLFDDDPIGTVELTYDDIIKAIEKGKSTWVDVTEQGGNQLLLIQISASYGNSNYQAFIDGYKY